MKPILFNSEMVRAIQDERKTVTRRIAKPQPPKDVTGTYWRMDNGNYQLKIAPYEYIYDYEIKPRYQVGDILYVRETWRTTAVWNGSYTGCEIEYKAGGREVFQDRIIYRDFSWKPSIHMPKEIARYFLRVTDVRVERLQDMTLDDFLSEGIVLRPEAFNDPDNAYYQAKEQYEALWNSTCKKSNHARYGWEANPWVFVTSFQAISKQEAYNGGC